LILDVDSLRDILTSYKLQSIARNVCYVSLEIPCS